MKKKIDLVLSGGGARGLAHIGVINELINQGYEIASVTGTSIGSLIGAMFVLGKLQEFSQFLKQQTQESIINLMDFTISGHGLIRGRRFFKSLQDIASDRNIEEISIPITIIATDLISGKEVIINKGSLFQAVRASIAIPTIIKPIYKNGMILVDGGITNPFPLNHAPQNNLVLGVNLYAIESSEDSLTYFQNERNSGYTFSSIKQRFIQLRDWKKSLVDSIFTDTGNDFNYAGTFRRMSELMTAKIAQQATKITPPDILINIPLNASGLFDFHKEKELEELGRQKTIEALYSKRTNLSSKNRIKKLFNLWKRN